MRQPAYAAVILAGGLLLVANPTYGESGNEGLRAARRSIVEGVRDDVQRRLTHRKSEAKLGAKERRLRSKEGETVHGGPRKTEP